METRPIIKLELSFSDKLMNWASWAILAAMWVLVSFHYTNLPNTIPIHYNLAGTPDGYGHKGLIWLLPLLGSLQLGMLSILNQHPESFNYYGEITSENAPQQYAMATRTLRYVKLVVIALFGILAYQGISVAQGERAGISGWAMSIFAVAIVGRIGWHIYASSRLQKTDS